MSVPTWERETSKTEYIKQLGEYCRTAKTIVYKKPAKYREVFGDRFLNCTITAYLSACDANSTYIGPNADIANFDARIKSLEAAIRYVNYSEYIADLFLGTCEEVDHNKISKEQAKIGTYCFNIRNLLHATLKDTKDRKRKAESK